MSRGAPKGNSNAAKGKLWRDALDYQLKNYESPTVKKKEALRAIAKKVIEMALEGDHFAIKEVGERMDGKPTQPLSSDEENPLNVYSRIVIEHVDSKNA